METKHTPGPWTIADDMRGIGNARVAGVLDANGIGVANCGSHGEANARLIAAAPDMLDALYTLLDAIDGNRITVGDCNQARAAIAKATGVQS
jgi:hypothetical protein